MPKSRQFRPLLQFLLGFYRFGPIPLLLWFFACGVVLYFSAHDSPAVWMEGHASSAAFQDAQIADAWGLWLFMMLVSTPLPVLVLGGSLSVEFILTRAVDRAIWVRAGRGVVILLVVVPLLAHLAWSPWAPQLAFNPAAPGTAAAAVQARYVSLFPGSRVQPMGVNHDEQLVVKHGTEWFAVWLVWAALGTIALVTLYFSWIYVAWQRAGWHHAKSKWRPWLGGLMIYAPVISAGVVYVGCTLWKINFYEESFLCFAAHPVPLLIALAVAIALIQPYSGRSVRELEFEFV